MDKLHWKSATEIAQAIREKDISSVEALEHFLERVDRINPDLNAIVWQNRDGARARAKDADAALANGESWGPLHGVPFTVKDTLDVAGAPATWGVPSLKSNVASTSALAVQRLEQAGGILFGKTNVPKMLADWQTYNDVYGLTRNPWNPELTPGGSSGGSAAALAAGITGLEAGSDIGGSLRNPAHYCGVFSLKPTWGVISPKGHALPGFIDDSDISVIGPMARSAEDLDLALDVMAGPDDIDGTCWRLDLPKCEARSFKDLRIAVKLTDPNSEIDGAYADKLQNLVDELARRGAQIREVEPELDTGRMQEIFLMLLRAATSSRATDADIEKVKEMVHRADSSQLPYVELIVKGATLSHREWLGISNERMHMRRKFNDFFNDWDLVLCPVAASAAPPHDLQGERFQRTVVVNGKPVATTDQVFWAAYSGMLYLPSTIGPAGLTASGLPVGYQAIAASGHDRWVTTFSRMVEREICGFVPPTPLAAS